jgi:hypothetical protein
MKEQFTGGDWLNVGTTVYALQDSVRLGKTTKINRFQFFIQGRCSGEEVLANAILAKASPKMYWMIDSLIKTLDDLYPSNARHVADEHMSEFVAVNGLKVKAKELLAEARGEKSDSD